MDLGAVREYLLGLQRSIVEGLEALDGGSFRADTWERPEGGGGSKSGMQEGAFFLRGGVWVGVLG